MKVGIKDIHHKVKPDQVELIRRDYYANGGWETFLSYEDPKQDILIGLLRLRRCSTLSFRPELNISIGGTGHFFSLLPIHFFKLCLIILGMELISGTLFFVQFLMNVGLRGNTSGENSNTTTREDEEEEGTGTSDTTLPQVCYRGQRIQSGENG